MPSTTLEIRSRISREGELKLWLEEIPLPRPRPNELVVRVEAAPLNPSDQILMLGSVDLTSLRASGTVNRPIIEGRVPPERLAVMSGRLDRSLAVGNEGAGTVIAAGSEVTSLIGRVVAIRATTGAPSTRSSRPPTASFFRRGCLPATERPRLSTRSPH
jgi:NADPH:quinone reductase-like Zn-dependent oxidoreductase